MFDWLNDIKFNDIYDSLEQYGVIDKAIDLFIALIILLIGFKIIKIIRKLINNRIEKSKLDPSLKSFILPLISITLKIALIISIASMVGIEMTSFIALLGTAGLAVGLALQGSLSNFAGGVLILMLKPFKVGDFIEAKSFSGTVKEIHIFYTILATPNNQKVVIPNSELSNSSVVNYSAYKTRRLDLTFSCSYDNDIHLVKDILINLITENELVLKDPEPQVVLGEYADNSINFKVRGWTLNQDYWNVYWDIMYKVKGEFDKHHITIPYPQIDVHMMNDKNE